MDKPHMLRLLNHVMIIRHIIPQYVNNADHFYGNLAYLVEYSITMNL